MPLSLVSEILRSELLVRAMLGMLHVLVTGRGAVHRHAFLHPRVSRMPTVTGDVLAANLE